ncbi:PREDICTED: putative ankyrin repeat protein RF_0580 [Acropora digitifera]|uniref:putative ankyrin repeat protein RF_0580 n=1 Tax=Acropora digitifera TaxID=70779 RepID=UPI00077A4866|nr:PREDICTED: putative ankyrin repeat protein RF_0580 [Acropora digitifera]
MDANVKDEILQGVPLHGAAEYSSIDAARVLLDHGAEINMQDLIGNTALHIACEHNQGEMKAFLLSHGADKNVVNSDGKTPAL